MYLYKWSINVSVNPVHWIVIVVWKNNTRRRWELKHPLTIECARPFDEGSTFKTVQEALE